VALFTFGGWNPGRLEAPIQKHRKKSEKPLSLSGFLSKLGAQPIANVTHYGLLARRE
jgi:hypothetical protein